MNLFFREIGEGDPIVILHGLFGSSDNWLSIAKALYNVNQAKAEAIEANQPMLTQSLLKIEERFEFPSRIACLLSQSFSDVKTP